ncbi:protein rep [Yoonia tamlensis]|uniref:protein rep n=1 Tax=Yoonia tamlensis TaxID=390270 RepID=UPI000B7E2F48|nr:protein rep [Yoonia tamlensis]
MSKPAQPALGNLRNRYALDLSEVVETPKKTRLKEPPENAQKVARREDRFALQRTAAKLVPNQRVAHCHWTAQSNEVELVKRQNDARFTGLQTCGSIWACPVCSARISEVRRGELRDLEAWAGSPLNDVRMVMMTLTARHRRRNLRRLMAELARAKARMQNRAAWKNLRKLGILVGSVSVREATYGVKNGWHPHYHVILLVSAGSDDEALDLLEPLREVWLECLRKEGLTGTAKRAFHTMAGDAFSSYVSKFGRDEADKVEKTVERSESWGFAEEATLSRTKKGRGDDDEKSRSPVQLLREAQEGDSESGRLWQEYANAFHGKRQQVWSNGLKALVGIEEIEDEEAAEGEEYTEEQDELIASWPRKTWKVIRNRRGDLLTAAERGGAEEVQKVLDKIPESSAEVPDLSRPPPPKPGGLIERLMAQVQPA